MRSERLQSLQDLKSGNMDPSGIEIVKEKQNRRQHFGPALHYLRHFSFSP